MSGGTTRHSAHALPRMLPDSLGDITGSLKEAKPAALARLYRELDLSMRYVPGERAVYMRARPRVDSARVRGAARKASTRNQGPVACGFPPSRRWCGPADGWRAPDDVSLHVREPGRGHCADRVPRRQGAVAEDDPYGPEHRILASAPRGFSAAWVNTVVWVRARLRTAATARGQVLSGLCSWQTRYRPARVRGRRSRARTCDPHRFAAVFYRQLA